MKDYDIKKDLDSWLKTKGIKMEPGKLISYDLLFAAWKARELLDQKLLQEINTLRQNLDYLSQKAEDRTNYLVDQIIEIAKARVLPYSLEKMIQEDIKKFIQEPVGELTCPRCESKTNMINTGDIPNSPDQESCDKCLHWSDDRVTDYLFHINQMTEDQSRHKS